MIAIAIQSIVILITTGHQGATIERIEGDRAKDRGRDSEGSREIGKSIKKEVRGQGSREKKERRGEGKKKSRFYDGSDERRNRFADVTIYGT